MHNHTSAARRVARAATLLLWGIGSAYLIQSVCSTVPRPVLNHLTEVDWVAVVATPVLWGVVISLPILAHHAFKEARLLASALLTAAAVVGSAFTLYGTISRQAEVRETARLEADASAKPVDMLAGEVADAKAAVKDAKTRADKACERNPDGSTCEVWTKREKAYRALVSQSIVQLSDATPPKPKDSGERFATQALTLAIKLRHPTVTDADVAPYVQAFGTSRFGLLFEIGALACGFYGFGPHRERSRQARIPKKGSEPFGGKLDEVKPALAAPATAAIGDEAALDADAKLVLAAFDGRQRALRNVDLAGRMGVGEPESTKRVAAAIKAGVVTKERVGRQVFIRPVAFN